MKLYIAILNFKWYCTLYISHVAILKFQVNMYTLLIVCSHCFVHGNNYFEVDGG